MYIYGIAVACLMKILILILLATLLLMSCCDTIKSETARKIIPIEKVEPVNRAEPVRKEKIDYYSLIDDYLKMKKIEPVVIVTNNDERHHFNLLEHTISWSYEQTKGIDIIIDGKHITTKGKVTLNPVWGENIDSLNYFNYIYQIKVYEFYENQKIDNTIIGFDMNIRDRNGIGCDVSYQLLYDLKIGKENYFGNYRGGVGLELYDFNNDGKVDYLGKTYNGRDSDTNLIEKNEYIMYSQSKDGKFRIFKDKLGRPYSFEHTFAEEEYKVPETFKDNWVEKIIKR